MKVLTRSRYGAAKSGSGRIRSDRQRPVAECTPRQAIPMITDFAITRADHDPPLWIAKMGGFGFGSNPPALRAAIDGYRCAPSIRRARIVVTEICGTLISVQFASALPMISEP